MIKIGLTGSIGMGKSTTAKIFKEEGVPVWDADAAVARLYAKGGAAVEKVAEIAPSAIVDRAVSKNELKTLIGRNPAFLKEIEKIVHPLVAQDRQHFMQINEGSKIILFDIPLLFENSTEAQFDKIVVVTTPAKTQRARVLERGTMNEQTFQMILAKQMPDAEKRKRADYVIETTTVDHARKQVQKILEELTDNKNA